MTMKRGDGGDAGHESERDGRRRLGVVAKSRRGGTAAGR